MGEKSTTATISRKSPQNREVFSKPLAQITSQMPPFFLIRNVSNVQLFGAHLAKARRRLQPKPRTDLQCVLNTRPLDALHHLRASIVLKLFPDGCVRHDWTASGSQPQRTTDQQNIAPLLQLRKQAALSPKHQQSPLPKTPNIDQLHVINMTGTAPMLFNV